MLFHQHPDAQQQQASINHNEKRKTGDIVYAFISQ